LFSALTFEMPSMVTSLVALRPPLMNGDEPGAGITPGLSAARENGLRPLSGRSTMRLFSIVWLMVELTVSIGATVAATVTVSAAPPISSRTSTARTCCTSTLISSTAVVRKPGRSTTTR
jgi:hypothetical protein